MMRNTMLDRLQKEGTWEIARYPMHYTDDMVKRMAMCDPKIGLQISLNGVLIIITMGSYKSIVINMRDIRKSRFSNKFKKTKKSQQ